MTAHCCGVESKLSFCTQKLTDSAAPTATPARQWTGNSGACLAENDPSTMYLVSNNHSWTCSRCALGRCGVGLACKLKEDVVVNRYTLDFSQKNT